MNQTKLTEVDIESAWKCAIIGEDADQTKPEEVEMQDDDKKMVS